LTNPEKAKRKTRSTKRSDVDRATAYALAVQSGEIVAGPYVRQACARHIADLKSAEKRGLTFDTEKARQAFAFFENVLRLNGGEYEGDPFRLEPWQAFIVGSLFGWVKQDGARRFQTAYIEIGKGNGKSPIAAGIGLFGLIADQEPRAEIYAAATKKDQAQILFRDAVAMVDQSPLLANRLTKSGVNPVWQLTDVRSGSWFKPISADDGQSGPRPHIALVDEVHEHRDSNVINMLRAGFKGRRQPLMVEITNSGVDRTSICYQHHEYSLRVVSGNDENDTWFAYVCALDDGDKPFDDPTCWPKANPNIDVSIKPAYLQGQIREAQGMPAQSSIVRRLNFCEWVDAINPWIDGGIWIAAEVPREEWAPPAGIKPVAGIDLGGTKDLTAAGLVWPPEGPGDPVFAKIEGWTPRETLFERSKVDKVPYDLWVEQGHLIATPGRAVDYKWLAYRLGEWREEYGLERVAFDFYKMKYLQAELDDLGLEFELIPHGQGWQRSKDSGLWMPHSITCIEGLLSSRRLRVCKNPALTFASASAVTEMDPQENRRFSKRKAKGRIDPLVALTMAVGLALDAEPQGIPDGYLPAFA
jgi:phage terminase large subunit-like protein